MCMCVGLDVYSHNWPHTVKEKRRKKKVEIVLPQPATVTGPVRNTPNGNWPNENHIPTANIPNGNRPSCSVFYCQQPSTTTTTPITQTYTPPLLKNHKSLYGIPLSPTPVVHVLTTPAAAAVFVKSEAVGGRGAGGMGRVGRARAWRRGGERDLWGPHQLPCTCTCTSPRTF